MEITISIISLLISAFSFVFSLVTYQKNVLHNRKKSTLDAFNVLQEQVLDKLKTYSKGDVKNISENTKTDGYKNITTLMARIEHFSVGVNSNVYDIKILKRLAGKHFYAIYDKLLPMIEKKRKINKTDKHYDEFELLIKNLKCLYKG